MPLSKKERLAELKTKSVDDDQAVIDGVRPISLGERLSWMASEPLEPSKTQKPLDIGFWDPMRDQMDFLDWEN